MSSLRDGLGQEEIQVSGLQASGTTAYINPYFLGSVTSVELFKAPYVYGTTGISGPGIVATTISGTNISGTNFYASVGSFSNCKATTFSGTNVYTSVGSIATCKATTFSGTNIYATTLIDALIGSIDTIKNSEGTLRPTKATSTFGALVQAGSDALSSSVKWVEFNTAYTGKPVVVATDMSIGSSLEITAGSLNAGSFFVDGLGTTGASDAFSWIAVGI